MNIGRLSVAEIARLIIAVGDDYQLTSAEEEFLTAVDKEELKVLAIERAHFDRKIKEANQKIAELQKEKYELEAILKIKKTINIS